MTDDASERGHRERSHTADAIVEAWGRTRADCLEEAVLGLTASFAALDDAPDAEDWHQVEVDTTDVEDALVELLSEVLFVLDARDAITVAAEVDDHGDRIAARLGTVPVGDVERAGAVPKAITYHQLSIGRDEDGSWRCQVTLDL